VHKGHELKFIFWKAVNATYETDFNATMKELGAKVPKAIEAFLSKGVPHFYKAFISIIPKCDNVDNNIVETLNSYVYKARPMPLIWMLEDIKTSLIERMHNKVNMMLKYDDVVCPRIMKKIEKLKLDSRWCTPIPALNNKFQVRVGEDQYIMDLNANTYSCRLWSLSGIPCSHAIFCIHYMKQDVVDYVDDYFKENAYYLAYKYALYPINGKKIWPVADGEKVKPLLYKKGLGKPKISRKK